MEKTVQNEFTKMSTSWPKWVRVYQNEYELTRQWVRIDQLSTKWPKWERVDLSTNWLEYELTGSRKFGIFLEADKQLFNLEHSSIICFIYLPPDKSPFYKTTETNGIKLLESHLLKSEFMYSNKEILIMGDLNARVANRDDFINDNHVVPSLRDYEDYLLDEVNVTRKSCDKTWFNFVKHKCSKYIMEGLAKTKVLVILLLLAPTGISSSIMLSVRLISYI